MDRSEVDNKTGRFTSSPDVLYPCHLYQQMNIFHRKEKFYQKLIPYLTSNNEYFQWKNFSKFLILHCWLAFDNLFIIAFSNDYIFHPPTNTLWSLLNKSAEKPKPCNNGGLQVFLRMLSCESLSKASSFSSVPSQNRPLLLSSDQRYSRVVYECYSPAGFGILSIKSWVCGKLLVT